MKTIRLTQGKYAIVDDEDYEELSKFTWHAVNREIRWYARRGWRDKDGKVKQLFMHNHLMKIIGIDHINGNGLDNRRCNLRPATRQQNNQNYHYVLGVSRYKGVCRGYKDSWYARIRHPTTGKKLHLGTFKREEEAARAYDAKAVELFGEFAWTNFSQ